MTLLNILKTKAKIYQENLNSLNLDFYINDFFLDTLHSFHNGEISNTIKKIKVLTLENNKTTFYSDYLIDGKYKINTKLLKKDLLICLQK